MRDQFRMLRLQQLDRGLRPIENSNISTRPAGGWLGSVREALGLTLEYVAQRLGSRRSNVLRFEKYEASDRITLLSSGGGCELLALAMQPKAESAAPANKDAP